MQLDIKKIREKLNLTQAELAEKLGVTGKTVSNWEVTGRISTPMKKKLMELANEGEQRRDAVDHVGRLLDIMEADRRTMDADRQFYQSELAHNRQQIDRLISIIEGRVVKKTEPSLA